MLEKLKQINLKDNITRFYVINAVIIGSAVVFSLISLFFVLQIVSLSSKIEDTILQSKRLQSDLSYYDAARKLTSENVEVYNELLRRLIPEKETYFAVISSLESLSIYTGIDVSRYSIDLPPKGSAKYSLSILGTIPVELLPVFLENYQYGTGRLVTVESMSYKDVPENNVRIQLNMYNQDVETDSITRIGSLSRDDIELMQEIQTKITRGAEIAGDVQRYKNQLEQLRKLESERLREEALRALTPTPRP
ncbi:MAG: hypothetical protein N2691_04000 [Patescibacteria group bacterium]|nr:hypothetical protein [Patescibacteria group bacterium]